MLTEDQIATHRESLRALCGPGGDLRLDSPHATMSNPRWFSDAKTPRRARLELHERLQERFSADDAPTEGRALILAGPPGAGKSTIFEKLFTAGEWRVLDPDRFKIDLLREAVDDASYGAFLKPESVRDLEAAGERWFPLELASLVHEESSFLSQRARHNACGRKINVAIDAVLGDQQKAVALGQQLMAAGYVEIQVVDVEATYEQSRARTDYRWEKGYRAAIDSGDPNYVGDGRWVPSEFGRSLYDDADGQTLSKSEHAVNALVDSCPAVQTWRRYRVAATTVPEPAFDEGWQRISGQRWKSLDA